MHKININLCFTQISFNQKFQKRRASGSYFDSRPEQMKCAQNLKWDLPFAPLSSLGQARSDCLVWVHQLLWIGVFYHRIVMEAALILSESLSCEKNEQWLWVHGPRRRTRSSQASVTPLWRGDRLFYQGRCFKCRNSWDQSSSVSQSDLQWCQLVAPPLPKKRNTPPTVNLLVTQEQWLVNFLTFYYSWNKYWRDFWGGWAHS